jgi:uncharacterized protein YndB with AHSA1/START domain
MSSTSTKHSQVHNTFVIERTYPVPVADVWHAMTDNDAREQWFGGGLNDTFEAEERSHEFKIGGGGFETGRWHDGPQTRFVSQYTNIVDQERFVYTYDLWVDAGHLSTSLTTVTMEAIAEGTRLTFTEQGVHYDGLDSPAQREKGTNGLLDQLGEYLTTAT